MLVQVWAEEDREPPWEGQLDLTDAETGATLEIGFDAGARAQLHAGFRRVRPRHPAHRIAQQRPLRRAFHRHHNRRGGLRPARAGRRHSSRPPCFSSISACPSFSPSWARSRASWWRCTCWTACASSTPSPRCASSPLAEKPPVLKHRRKLQQPWSLLLQLLSLLLLLLAIAQLRFGSPSRSSRDHVLILDTSAWMAARIGPNAADRSSARRGSTTMSSCFRPAIA